jgi:hypothetical protein
MALGPSRTRTTRWTPAAIPVGGLLMALGAWAFAVPLVGPYFSFGFFTDSVWSLSARHWELLLLPGVAICLGGLILTLPSTGLARLGGLLAFAGGAWLLVGPSLYPLWTSSDGVQVAVPHDELMTALLWVGYFYGTGGLCLWIAGFGKGLLGRRPVIADTTVIEETPIEREERVTTTA